MPKRAAAVSGIDCQVEKVTDVVRFLDFAIVALPALVIDGKVFSMGSVPTPAEIGRHLTAS